MIKKLTIISLMLMGIASFMAACGTADSSKDDSSTDVQTVEADGKEPETAGDEEEAEKDETESDDVLNKDDEQGEENEDEEADDEPEQYTKVDSENTDNGKEEDLKYSEIHGSTRGDIEYDDTEGYYILPLTAGFYNWTNQDVVDKWLAFALPKGVEVADKRAMTNGVLAVELDDGHTGIAVKVPNIRGIGSEDHQEVDIPLTGKPDDNDPNFNYYLLEVDGNKRTYQIISEIGSDNDLDFSVMEE
ncbi:hypothetical protein WMZ97_06590 [Lentibacillus sp. N15]|uniref:hypothetical protein n=1 Tax=Lentibacillus songyuanensis TaxID=3136161 RepID=UPI0031BAB9FF